MWIEKPKLGDMALPRRFSIYAELLPARRIATDVEGRVILLLVRDSHTPAARTGLALSRALPMTSAQLAFSEAVSIHLRKASRYSTARLLTSSLDRSISGICNALLRRQWRTFSLTATKS